VLKYRKRFLGKNHQDVSVSIVTIGTIHMKLKEYDVALKMMYLGEAMQRRILGDTHKVCNAHVPHT
jgi:hypothetical protein